MAKISDRSSVKCKPSVLTIELTKLYCSVVPDLYDIKCQSFLEEVKRNLKAIGQKKYDPTKCEEAEFCKEMQLHKGFNFKKPSVRCAYMYLYSVLNTGVAYSEFSKHLDENNAVVDIRLSRRVLKICCLGGGPGTDAVGVSRAIHDYIWKFSSEDRNSTVNIYVTVVDICSEWFSELSAIVNAMNKKSVSFNKKIVNFHANFLKADLLEPFNESLIDIIKEADIITVIKLLSNVQKRSKENPNKKLKKMVKRVIESMTEDSCLFMLDVAGGNVFHYIAHKIRKHYNESTLQMFSHKNRYRLETETLKEFEKAINFAGFTGTYYLLNTQYFAKRFSLFWIKKLIPSTKEEEKHKVKAPKFKGRKKRESKNKSKAIVNNLNFIDDEESAFFFE